MLFIKREFFKSLTVIFSHTRIIGQNISLLCLLLLITSCRTNEKEAQNKEAERLIEKAKIFINTSTNEVKNNDSILYYTNKAYAIAEKTKNKALQGRCFINFAGRYSKQGEYKKAEKEYFKSIELFKEANNKEGTALAQLNLGIIYSNLKEYYNSIKYCLLAAKFYEKEDQKKYYFTILVLAQNYRIIEDYDSAKKYYSIYKENILQTNSYLEIGQYYLGYAAVLENSGSNPDSIIYNYNKAMSFSIKSKNKSNLVVAYCRLAVYYCLKNDFKNAAKNIDACSKLENDPEVLNKKEIYLAKCIFYSSTDNVELAEKNGRKALEYTEESDDVNRKNIYLSLASIYHRHNMNDKAYEMFSLSDQYNSIVNNKANLDRIQNLKNKYEHDQSVRDIHSLKQKNTIQSLLLIIAGILLVFIIIITIILLNRRKLKAKSKLDEEIRKQQEINIAEVIKAEELERRRIAEHLHDGGGAGISAAILNVSVLNDIQEIDPQELHVKNKNILHQLRTVYDDLRTISHQMMPNSLIKAGLPNALKEFVNSVDNNKLEVSLYIHGLEARFNESVELIVYRAIQEIVTNVIKHANASKLKIELIKDPEGLHIMIEDNGIGFDKAAINDQNGIGIQNMISKIEFLNGTIDFDTSIGKGSLVVIYLPLFD
ncbi:hypothetical protein IW15_17805 [Chryseobacterium soli]|uniref:histidine kinase n=1 Tax=Chryseobacterium soli TaxID=445961 RepID=A0A086A2V6_9FLAO|nr:tetratricopeptide repeat-containing sensor histidine kinase [Chryseobacterium soli]KFF11020.1 hypothetical protein IW15_17805 [Chryseobacterium soli]